MNEQEKQALLDQLAGVQVPDVSAMPAPGWWVLLLSIVAGVLLARYYLKRHNSRRWQREARSEIAQLRDQLDKRPVSQTLSDTSKLARQILMVARGRQAVAQLHGKPWLDALDELCGRALFVEGFGRLLETGQYQRSPDVKSADLHSLMDAMDELISAAARQSKRDWHVE